MCGPRCLIEEYEYVNKHLKSWVFCIILLMVGVSATCLVFGTLGFIHNSAPREAYTVLFTMGFLGSCIVVLATILYTIGGCLSSYYTLPLHGTAPKITQGVRLVSSHYVLES